MFGNILIDKLRFSKKVNLIQNPYQVKDTLDEILRHHFIEDAFSVEKDRQYLRVEFTPTRYIDKKHNGV